jgi:hypothetical protein
MVINYELLELARRINSLAYDNGFGVHYVPGENGISIRLPLSSQSSNAVYGIPQEFLTRASVGRDSNGKLICILNQFSPSEQMLCIGKQARF